MTRPRGARLLVRIFAYGVVVLVATAIAAVAIETCVIKPRRDVATAAWEAWLSGQLCSEHLSAAPPPPHKGRPFAATLFAKDGRVVDSTITPPYDPLSQEQLAEMEARGGALEFTSPRVRAHVCPSTSEAAYVVFQGPPLRYPLRDVATLFGIALLVVVLASWPVARSIATPIEKLVATTRAFGGGDMTARAPAARGDEIGDLARAFNDMAERIEHHMRSEKELLANVSHELRTPLARIRVVLETAQENPVRAAALLAEIDQDVYDLERLVEDVMDTIRFDAVMQKDQAPLPAHLEPTDVGAVVRDAVHRFGAVHRDRAVEVDIAPDLPAVDADARLLRRLLDNLLANATKYSDAGSRIDVRARDGNGHGGVVVEVEDHGIGIHPEDLPHVFRPFFRADRSRTRSTGGAGLGLALAKKIAEVHHGEIDIRSAPGKGTTVTVQLGSARA